MSTPLIVPRRGLDLPLLAVVGAIVFWSIAPLLVVGSTVSALTFTFWRLWLAVPVMWAAAYALGGRISWSLMRRAAVPGCVFGVSMITSFGAFRNTSVANATLIPSLTPAVVLVFAPRLLGEQRTARRIAWAVVAFAGVAVVVLGGGAGGEAHVRGDLFAVGNLVAWAAYLIMSKKIRNEGVHAWALIAAFFTVAAVFCTPFCVIGSDDLGASTGKDWWLYAAMVVVSGLLGHGFMTWAQEHVDLSLSSVLTLANAPLSMVGAWILFGEALKPVQIAGVLVVIVALAMIALDQTALPRSIPVEEVPT